ncbi:hypothetical protein [Telluria beijingensis]|uniref:hypothetical protein n=1 Tax=Telluria beijingensis TaxID=3068633 RepID=UPI0027952AA8|nr:hypothetical protein [Massilia sp. REN29]
MPTPYKLLLAAIVAAGLLSLCTFESRLQLPAPVVMRSVHGVDGFEVRHVGFAGAGAEGLQPRFGLDNALQAGTPFVLYGDRIYRRAGPGGFIVRPRGDARARYLVEEHADRPNSHSGNITSLSISDIERRELLGRKFLRNSPADVGKDGLGQQALGFVRTVLVAPAPGLGVAGPSSGAAPATQAPLRPGRIDPPVEGGDGCPPNYSIDRLRRPLQFDAGAWAFRARADARSFACTANFIVVDSGNGARLQLDLLDANSTHLFQTWVALPFDEDATVTVERLRVNGQRLQIDVHRHPGKLPDGKPSARQRLRLVISMAPPEVAPPSTQPGGNGTDPAPESAASD